MRFNDVYQRHGMEAAKGYISQNNPSTRVHFANFPPQTLNVPFVVSSRLSSIHSKGNLGLNFLLSSELIAVSLSVNHGSSDFPFQQSTRKHIICWTSPKHIKRHIRKAFLEWKSSLSNQVRREFCSVQKEESSSTFNWSTRGASKSLGKQSKINQYWLTFSEVIWDHVYAFSIPHSPRFCSALLCWAFLIAKLKIFFHRRHNNKLPCFDVGCERTMCELMFFSVLGFIIVQFACLSCTLWVGLHTKKKTKRKHA